MKSETMWNQLAKNWDTPGVGLGEYDLKIIEMTKKYLNPGSVVLDYGCRTGSIALEIASMAKTVHGIDISSNMIEIAKSKADERNIKNIGFARAAMSQMNLPTRAYHRTRSVNLVRTIADLAGSEEIQSAHLAEALHASRSSEVDVRVNIRKQAAARSGGGLFVFRIQGTCYISLF